MLLLADIVAPADALTATRSRSAKISLVADLLRRAAVDDLRAVVGLLIAAPRQGRLGVGWRSIRSRAAAHAEVAATSMRPSNGSRASPETASARDARQNSTRSPPRPPLPSGTSSCG